MTRAHLLGATLATACNLSTFDDQRRRAWSDSQGKPDGVASSDYGIAITTIDREQPGATIVVAGGNPLSLATLSYDDGGVAAQRGAAVPQAAQASVPNLAGALEPVAGGDGVFAITGLAGPEPILLYDARTGDRGPIQRLAIQEDVCGPSLEGMGHAMAIGVTGLGTAAEPELIVLAGQELLVFPDIALDAQPVVCHRCRLVHSGGGPGRGMYVATDEFAEAEGEEIAVSIEAMSRSGPGELVILTAAAVEAAAGGDCTSDERPPVARIASPDKEPDFGHTFVVIDVDENEDKEVALTVPSTQRVYVAMNLAAGGAGGPLKLILSSAGSVAFGETIASGDFDRDRDGTEELAIGDPAADHDRTKNAGRVTIYSFNPEDEDFENRATLYDSTPEPDQRFGRALSVAEFVASDEPADLLIVSARGEVFTYFQIFAGVDDPRQ